MDCREPDGRGDRMRPVAAPSDARPAPPFWTARAASLIAAVAALPAVADWLGWRQMRPGDGVASGSPPRSAIGLVVPGGDVPRAGTGRVPAAVRGLARPMGRGKVQQLRRVAMVSRNHDMLDEFADINAPLATSPPVGSSTGTPATAANQERRPERRWSGNIWFSQGYTTIAKRCRIRFKYW